MTPAPPDIAVVAAIALITLAGASQLVPPPFLVNESASLPRGLYVRAPWRSPAVGDVVALRPGPTARAYLRSLGAPPGARLLKRVAAQAGDQICAEGDQVRLPSRSVTTLAHDRQGRALPHWMGCQVLAPDQAFLLGDSEASFDSRYFGPVARADLDGVFRPVLTW